MLIKLVLTGLWGFGWHHTGFYAFSDHHMRPETIRGPLTSQGLQSRDGPRKEFGCQRKEDQGEKGQVVAGIKQSRFAVRVPHERVMQKEEP